MYRVQKTLEISASHKLRLSYASPCQQLHGHNWKITVYCKSETLNNDGMVVDFAHIKREITERFDHKDINEVVPFNPTAENLAAYLCDMISHCYRVDVQESENNIATYERT